MDDIRVYQPPNKATMAGVVLFQKNFFKEDVLLQLNDCMLEACLLLAGAWSSLVEGDEQLDRPNSQTTMEYCHA